MSTLSISGQQPVRTLLIDNYDSYTYNLYHQLAVINGVEPHVCYNDDAQGSYSQLLVSVSCIASDCLNHTLYQYNNVLPACTAVADKFFSMSKSISTNLQNLHCIQYAEVLSYHH
jgi:hypothetical protein